MTKDRLNQIRYLKNEIKLLQKEYREMETPMVADCVTGSRTSIPYDKHAITITGIDYGKIRRAKRKIERKISELMDELDELECYIDTIGDSEIRQIIRLRYRNGLSWQQIAFEIGHHDEQYPRRKFDKFIENDENDEK